MSVFLKALALWQLGFLCFCALVKLITMQAFETMVTMKVTLLGTGTSHPDPDRVQSGVLVEVNDIRILFDIGSGVLQRLVSSLQPILDIQHVFLSHFHIDHVSDFIAFCQTLWISGYDKKLNVYGPDHLMEWSRGIHEVAFPYMRGKVNLEMRVLEEKDAVPIGNIIVSCTPTCHGDMHSRAFRVEHGGKSIVYSSDTSPCPEVLELADGTDLLIHECNWMDGRHPPGVHTSPSELAQIAEATEPKTIVLTHLGPDVAADIETAVSIVSRRTNARVLAGADLLSVTV